MLEEAGKHYQTAADKTASCFRNSLGKFQRRTGLLFGIRGGGDSCPESGLLFHV